MSVPPRYPGVTVDLASGAVRVLLVHVAPWTCTQKMHPGDARRWAKPGEPAFSYTFCCPSCWRVTMHLADEEMGLTEGPLVKSAAPFGVGSPVSKEYVHPEEMTSTKPSRCPGCGGWIRLEGRWLVVDPPGTRPR